VEELSNSSRHEIVFTQLQFRQNFIFNFFTCLVKAGIQCGFNAQPFGCGRIRYQVYYYLVTHKRLAPPILRNVAEHSMLNLVPLTCSGWKVTNMNGYFQFVCRVLQSRFP
jgi:hypothetical protein